MKESCLLVKKCKKKNIKKEKYQMNKKKKKKKTIYRIAILKNLDIPRKDKIMLY